MTTTGLFVLENSRMICRSNTHHADAVVEQRLPEQHDIQHLIHVNLLEHGQHSDRVDRGEQRREHEAVQEVERPHPGERPDLRTPPDRHPDRERVVDRRDEGEEENRSEVVEEGAVRHEVARVEDDRRKEIEEEGRGVEGVALDVVHVQDHADDDAEDDQEAALGEDGRQPVVEVEPYEQGTVIFKKWTSTNIHEHLWG